MKQFTLAQPNSPVVAWCQGYVNLRMMKLCGERCFILKMGLRKFKEWGFLLVETLQDGSRILEFKDPWHHRKSLWWHHVVTISFNDYVENSKWRVLGHFYKWHVTAFAYIPNKTGRWSLVQHIAPFNPLVFSMLDRCLKEWVMKFQSCFVNGMFTVLERFKRPWCL